MKATFYILCIFTLLSSIVIASESDWRNEFPERWQSQLYMILIKGFDKESMQSYSRHSLNSISIYGDEIIESVQAVLKRADKTPLDMYNILVETLHPEFAELSKSYYKEERDLSRVSEEFNEFDVKFYKKLGALTESFSFRMEWDELKDVSSKEELMCEAAFFYGLIDFERAITCLGAASCYPLTAKVFSSFVADMYLGEAERPDFSFEGDVETRKWLDEMVKKYQGGHHLITTSLMRHFTRRIRGKVDDKLWNDYMRAMMTVHLSAAFLLIKVKCLKDMYDYLADNNIQDEFMFASRKEDPLQPGGTVQPGHAFLRTFKFDPSTETATMGIINSGDGLPYHDKIILDSSKLPDTISRDPHEKFVFRFIPFIVYDGVSRRDWLPAYAVASSAEQAYFGLKQKKHEFSGYKPWQYIDDQRAGTCTAMSLWVALYWFEQKSQQILESFRLTLYLEVLKEAAEELHKLRTELKGLGDQIFEMDDDAPGRDKLQKEIDEKSETEDDFLRFFSVGFNSAIRSIRYLHTDPFKQKLNMTTVMQSYADFYESQGDKEYWKLIKPNIEDLFHATYLRIMRPMIWVTPLNLPKITGIERNCIGEVNQAIKSKNPFNFVKAVIRGTDLKCQSKAFLESIHSRINEVDLQTHHQDLILRALAKEIRLLSGGGLSILRFVVKLIDDYNFKLFPTYDVPKNASIDFNEESHQVVLFKDDMEMKQFAANCTAFDLLAKNVLAAAYDLFMTAWKSSTSLKAAVDIYDREEYKIHENLVQHVASELRSIDPHIYAQYFGSLIWNNQQTGISGHLKYFTLPGGLNLDDYTLLVHATKGSGPHKDSIKDHIDKLRNLFIGRELASKHLPPLPTDLPDDEYIYTGAISRAVDADSPLNFIKAIFAGLFKKCKSDLFLSSAVHGISTLKLQPHHQQLILQTFLRSKNASEMLEFVNKLITEHGFKLFLTDDTSLEETTPIIINLIAFVVEIGCLENENDIRKLAAGLNADKSPASIILALCTEHSDLAGLRQRFVDHVFKELREMDEQTRNYYLDKLISQGVLKAEEFTSAPLESSKE